MSLKKISFCFSAKYTWKNCLKIFFGCPKCSNSTKIRPDVTLLKILEFDLNLFFQFKCFCFHNKPIWKTNLNQ